MARRLPDWPDGQSTAGGEAASGGYLSRGEHTCYFRWQRAIEREAVEALFTIVRQRGPTEVAKGAETYEKEIRYTLWGYHLPWPGYRSPQVRALTFLAYLPHLPHQLLIAWRFVVTCQLARLVWPRMRFVSLRACPERSRRGAILPPASFRPHLAVTPLPLADGWPALCAGTECNQPL